MSETSQPITLTDKAAGKIKELLGEQENGVEQALRVAVRGGGCSGFQYALAFDAPKEGDHRFETDGVAVVVDKTSMQFVFGSEVDWVDGLQGAGFAVNNPNVEAACGCGSSFQVKEETAEQAVENQRQEIVGYVEIPVTPPDVLRAHAILSSPFTLTRGAKKSRTPQGVLLQIDRF